MDRETVRNAVLGLVGVLAVSLSAATLSNPLEGGERDGDFVAPPAYDTPAAAIDESVLLVLAAVVGVGVLWYLYLTRRTLYRRILLVVGVAIFTSLVLYLRLPNLLFPEADPTEEFNESGRPPEVNRTFANESGGSIAAQTEFQVTVGWIVIALLVASVLVVAFKWITTDEEPATGSETSSNEAAAVGRAAGRAADRIERNADVDNEIYRAWREMTDLLDTTSPESRTPGEFERAAVAAGLDRDDVHELTRLFERVRYGDHDPVEDDERRAVEIFRGIERTYAEDES